MTSWLGRCSKLMMSLRGERAFLCIIGLGYQEARLANICSRVAGAHCDEVATAQSHTITRGTVFGLSAPVPDSRR